VNFANHEFKTYFGFNNENPITLAQIEEIFKNFKKDEKNRTLLEDLEKTFKELEDADGEAANELENLPKIALHEYEYSKNSEEKENGNNNNENENPSTGVIDGKKREEFYFEITCSPISHKDSFCLLINLKDITVSIESHKEKIRKEYRNILFTTTSHELKTPLNAIIGTVQLIETAETMGMINQYVQILNNSTSHLINIIQDMLVIYKYINTYIYYSYYYYI
jgi:nitrogen-specific signal transduction histidine kinase